ncbi:ABC transporter ATP-binding protein [Catenulispora rubra]|uniref:ABC transporter ATP-binding protein n=1 Tax=Catenulispora rubra TaxID=280293 RepID=UPI001891FBE8|nr:ABC transporter ATP-binding protein [Catenulispora rubra]
MTTAATNNSGGASNSARPTGAAGPAAAPLLAVRDLTVRYRSEAGPVTAVTGLSFDVAAGETLGIVGESGSGKSAASMAIMGLLPSGTEVTGSIRLRGEELLTLSDTQMRDVRGRPIAIVFQDALSALNPMMTVGAQLAEAVAVHHRDRSRAELHERAAELLDLVGIPDPRARLDQYPHEYSGGMRQRALIAMSIANDPEILIADEPTTALDVTVQAQVLEVIERVQERTDTAVVLITHDLGVVAGLADRVLVLYSGTKLEEGPVDDLFHAPAHPYTQGLLAALPRVDRKTARLVPIPGQPPSPHDRPVGCPFGPRCAHTVAGVCDVPQLPMTRVSPGHDSACARVLELMGAAR